MRKYGPALLLIWLGFCISCNSSIPKAAIAPSEEWETVLEQDFTELKLERHPEYGMLYSEDWVVRKGPWTVTAEGLVKDLKATEGVLICRLPLLKDAVRIDMKVMSHTPGDMSLIMGTNAQENPYSPESIFIGFAASDNQFSMIEVPVGKPIENREAVAVPGKWHTLTVIRAGGEVSLAIDEKEVLRTADMKEGFTYPYIGFYGWHKGIFRSIRVQRRKDKELEAYLAPAAFKREQNFSDKALSMSAVKSDINKNHNWQIYDRAAMFEALDSFDHKGLSEADFEKKTLALLTPEYGSAQECYDDFIAKRPVEPVEIKPNYDTTAADRVMDGFFSFYKEEYELGHDFDWNENPGTAHWGHDLNRFNYIYILVAAGRQTGEHKYYDKAIDLILDWVRKNDVSDAPEWDGETSRSKYVWSSYLNIAIHLQCWSRNLDKLLPYMEPAELMELIKSIHDQMRWLERVIPNHSNNWVLIGSGDLLEVCKYIPELRDRDRIIDFAWQNFVNESKRQVLPDGVQFELTQHYHKVVYGLLANAIKMYEGLGKTVPDDMKNTANAMLDYLMHNMTPDGKLVAFNDSDPDTGKNLLKQLQREAELQGRDDWLYVGTQGKQGTPPEKRSQAFPYGGVYVMRTGWDPENTMLVFDGGPWGKSHQHNDRLAFWLAAYGRSVLIDPGRYLYDWDNPYSPYLKTTQAHNTITIDGENQADKYFKNTWAPGPELTQNIWEDTGDFQRVVSQHILGYGEKGAIDVKHKRAVLFWQPDMILIVDEVTGEGSHAVASRLHCAPGELIEKDGLWHTGFGDGDIAIIPWMSAEYKVAVIKGQLEPETMGWYSCTINDIKPSPTMVITAETELPLKGAFLIAPYKNGVIPEAALTIEGETITVTVGDKKQTITFVEAFD